MYGDVVVMSSRKDRSEMWQMAEVLLGAYKYT